MNSTTWSISCSVRILCRPNGDITVRQLIEEGIQKFGEKIEVVRMERLSVK